MAFEGDGISMSESKKAAASGFVSRLDLNAEYTDSTPYTYWCRVVYSRIDRLNLKPQRHSFFELQLCLRGSCEYRIDGREFSVSEGEFILIPPQREHTILGATEDFEKFNWGFAAPDEADGERLADAVGKVTSLGNIPDGWFHSVERIINEGMLTSECSVAVIRGELQYLYIGLLRRFLPHRTNTDAARKIGVRADAIRNFIKDNLSLTPSVSDIAAQFYLSERQLERICHAEYKMSVGRLITAVRAEAIRDMLGNTTLSMSEIAARTGFSDRYSMSKFFAREEGFPPAKYRAALIE